MDDKKSSKRFAMCIKARVIIQILIVAVAVTVGAVASFGEYIVVDKNAPRDTEKVVTVSAGDKKVEFRDRGDRKVFEVEWDASGKKLIVKGDNVYLRIHSNGKIEKLTTIPDNQNENTQQPVSIHPIVPIYPRQVPGTIPPSPPSTTK